MAASRRESNVEASPLCDKSTGRHFLVRPQPSDIDACVSLSVARCFYSVIGILLVLTDIPRTSFAVNPSSYFPVVGPGAVMYYGPYAYPLVHLNRSGATVVESDVVEAFFGGDRVEDVAVWAYKFDTLSIPTRALAKHLNVSSYPRCILYEKNCETITMRPSVTFSMLNDLMTAIQREYFDLSATRRNPVVFETFSYWADRLHHIVLGYRRDRRIHSVRRFASNRSLNSGERLGVDICQARSASERHRPMLCSLPVKWMSDHPTLGAGEQIPIQESIRLRFSNLQQRYPDTVLELMLITTRSPLNSRTNAFFPSVYYDSDNLEVTTLIRGRRCPLGESCRVEFVDDYRYERATLETSSHEMKFTTGTLRAFSQAYIWLRMILLVSICCQSRLVEPSMRSMSPLRKVVTVMRTLLLIPSHTIVYSSRLPVIVYAAAHYIDCGLVPLITDNFWASSNGFFAFDFVGFIIISSVQMRNIWFIASFWKATFSLVPIFFTTRNTAWRPQHGIFAFRGVFVGTISCLTTFSFMPALRFRNTKVLEFVEVPRHSDSIKLLFSPRSTTMSDFGPTLDVKTTAAAFVIVVGFSFALQTLLRIIRQSPARFLACHNFYVPFTAGELFPASALNVFWSMRLKPRRSSTTVIPQRRKSSITESLRRVSSRVFSAVMPLQPLQSSCHCRVCGFVPGPLHWQPTQGCTRHQSIFSLGARSVETQSMVRLVNIGGSHRVCASPLPWPSTSPASDCTRRLSANADEEPRIWHSPRH